MTASLDRAGTFSVQYLDIVEERLHFARTDTGHLVFDPFKINEFTIRQIRDDLYEHCKGSELDNATIDFESYGKSKPARIQTTAVGYANDFETLVKLGIMLGERVVLWDNVFRNALLSNEIHVPSLGSAAQSLLELRDLVEAGGACILPHPTVWLDRAQAYFRHLQGHVSNEYVGFVNANALLAEDFAVHPYTYQDDRSKAKTLHRTIIGSEFSRFGSKKLDEHYRLQRTLEDKSMVFLRQAKPVDFYDALRQTEGLRTQTLEELAETLRSKREDVSPEEFEGVLDQALKSVGTMVEEHNRELARHKALSTLAGAGAIGAVGALMAIVTGQAEWSFISLLSGGLGVAGGLGGKLDKLLSKPKASHPALYQVFTKLEDAAEQRFLEQWEHETLGGLIRED